MAGLGPGASQRVRERRGVRQWARTSPTTRPPTTAGPRPVRRPLGRDQILREAVRLIDEHGRDRLTMRRLGGALGVEAMALYRYVPGREQLLDGVVEFVMNELWEKTMTGPLPGSWQEYLQKLAHGVRDIAVAHPRVFPLVATRPPAAPWLRPPLRSLRWVESFLAGAGQVRLHRPGQRADLPGVRHFPARPPAAGVGDPGLHGFEWLQDVEFFESNDLALYPRLLSLADELARNGYDVEFEDSLEDLINRIRVFCD